MVTGSGSHGTIEGIAGSPSQQHGQNRLTRDSSGRDQCIERSQDFFGQRTLVDEGRVKHLGSDDVIGVHAHQDQSGPGRTSEQGRDLRRRQAGQVAVQQDQVRGCLPPIGIPAKRNPRPHRRSGHPACVRAAGPAPGGCGDRSQQSGCASFLNLANSVRQDELPRIGREAGIDLAKWIGWRRRRGCAMRARLRGQDETLQPIHRHRGDKRWDRRVSGSRRRRG